jgi:transposase
MNSKAGRPSTLTPFQKFDMRKHRENGMSVKQCASYFDVSIATAMRVLAEQRKLFGPEQLKNRQSARSHLFMSQN